MPIFKIDNQKLTLIQEKKINLERDLQRLTEANLETVFGYQLVASELIVQNFRIDTLAWNSETNSFVIIEYKKERNFSVVDQGFAYLSLLLNNKADFLLEYNERMPKALKRDDVDWSQSRVVFIAPEFTSYQVHSVNFRDMAFDLYEVKLFENSTILYEPIKPSETSDSIRTVSKNPVIEKVTAEIRTYTIDDHFKPNWPESRAIFDELSEQLLAIDPNLELSPQKHYIGYKLASKNVFTIQAYKMGPTLVFMRTEPKDLQDPEHKAQYWKNSFKHFNQHQSFINLASLEDVDYAVMLARQVYKRYKANAQTQN